MSDSADIPAELLTLPGYQVTRLLGRGGMGEVYLGRNEIMDREEVLKVINTALLTKTGALERFIQEIRSAAKLQHQNIVSAYSVLQPGKLLIFAMEYVAGRDLRQIVKAKGPLQVANACLYIQMAARGLQHAFEKMMVHRDIKPSNLILQIDDSRKPVRHTVKILDFGLAKASSEKPLDGGLTSVGQILGSPDYISPEQSLDSTKADIRSDIYSLGCTFYYLLTGRPPYREASLLSLLQAHHDSTPQPIRDFRSDVPDECVSIIDRMMAKKPADRFQTPAELANALTPLIRGSATKSGSTQELNGIEPERRSSTGLLRPQGPMVNPVDLPNTMMEPLPSFLPQSVPLPTPPSAPPTRPHGAPVSRPPVSAGNARTNPVPEEAEPESQEFSQDPMAHRPSARRKPASSKLPMVFAAMALIVLAMVGTLIATGAFTRNTDDRKTDPPVAVVKGKDPGSVATAKGAPKPKGTTNPAVSLKNDPPVANPNVEPNAPAGPEVDVLSGNWTVRGKEFGSVSGTVGEIAIGEPTWQNYECSVQIQEVDPRTGFIKLRLFESDEGSITIETDPANRLLVTSTYPGGAFQTEAFARTKPLAAFRKNEWYTLAAKRNGERLILTLSQNGTTETDTLSGFRDSVKGRVALMTDFRKCWFRNWTVKDSQKVLWEGTPVFPPIDRGLRMYENTGFEPVFNGRSLENWSESDATKPGGAGTMNSNWKVTDRCLCFSGVNGEILSDVSHKSFVARVRYEISPDTTTFLRFSPRNQRFPTAMITMHPHDFAVIGIQGNIPRSIPTNRPPLGKEISLDVEVNDRDIVVRLTGNPMPLSRVRRPKDALRPLSVGFVVPRGNVKILAVDVKVLPSTLPERPALPSEKGKS
jgi:serine/threonine protein kinase